MHQLLEPGAYIVTAGTYQKQHHLRTAKRLDLVMATLFQCAEEFGWPWCSAGWFERESRSAFRRLLDGVQIDRVHLADAFEPVAPGEEEDKAASSRRTPHQNSPTS